MYARNRPWHNSTPPLIIDQKMKGIQANNSYSEFMKIEMITLTNSVICAVSIQ